MPRNLGLALLQNLYEIADTYFAAIHQIEQPQPCRIGERSEQANQVERFGETAHGKNIRLDRYVHQEYICIDAYERWSRCRVNPCNRINPPSVTSTAPSPGALPNPASLPAAIQPSAAATPSPGISMAKARRAACRRTPSSPPSAAATPPRSSTSSPARRSSTSAPAGASTCCSPRAASAPRAKPTAST